VDVNRSSETGSTVGGAGSNVAEVTVLLELEGALKGSRSSDESLEDLEEGSSLLHRDNSELIFFVNPHKESFALVVEDSSA
jgi:hypothetical protein